MILLVYSYDRVCLYVQNPVNGGLLYWVDASYVALKGYWQPACVTGGQSRFVNDYELICYNANGQQYVSTATTGSFGGLVGFFLTSAPDGYENFALLSWEY